MQELQTRRGLETVSQTIAELSERVIPPLEKQVDEEGAQIEKVQVEVEEVRPVLRQTMLRTDLQAKVKVQRAKVVSRDLQTLKNAASLVSRTLDEIKDLQTDISRLERDLESTGSLKTVEEVQAEVDQLTSDM